MNFAPRSDSLLSDRDRAEDNDQARYDHLYNQIDREHEIEHMNEFGYPGKFKYKANNERIHDCVLWRMAEIEAE